jgi:hypothetical protein
MDCDGNVLAAPTRVTLANDMAFRFVSGGAKSVEEVFI